MGYSAKWLNILNIVYEFSSSRGIVFFRGHSVDSYELRSGLFREPFKTLNDFLISESAKYTHFRTLGNLEHSSSGWDLLYIMQHHGVRTRLLDWTESFSTALFFAFKDWNPSKNSACIWMLDPGALNKKSTNISSFIFPEEVFGDYAAYINGTKVFPGSSTALYPGKNSKRMVAQQGAFTLQGNTALPLEKEFGGSLVTEGSLIKITLDSSLVVDIQTYLRMSGVNYYSLFPDLDGLARHVNDPLMHLPLTQLSGYYN
jgi:hypothetical protein